MLRTLLNRIAPGLVNAGSLNLREDPNQSCSTEVDYFDDVTPLSLKPSPADYGFSEDVMFTVQRGSQRGNVPCSWEQIMQFLQACGIDPDDESILQNVLSGVPIPIDGQPMIFHPVLGASSFQQ